MFRTNSFAGVTFAACLAALGAYLVFSRFGWDFASMCPVVMTVLIIPFAFTCLVMSVMATQIARGSDQLHDDMLTATLVTALIALPGLGSWFAVFGLWVASPMAEYGLRWLGFLPGLAVVVIGAFMVSVTYWSDRYRHGVTRTGTAMSVLVPVLWPQVGAFVALSFCHSNWDAAPLGSAFTAVLALLVVTYVGLWLTSEWESSQHSKEDAGSTTQAPYEPGDNLNIKV